MVGTTGCVCLMAAGGAPQLATADEAVRRGAGRAHPDMRQPLRLGGTDQGALLRWPVLWEVFSLPRTYGAILPFLVYGLAVFSCSYPGPYTRRWPSGAPRHRLRSLRGCGIGGPGFFLLVDLVGSSTTRLWSEAKSPCQPSHRILWKQTRRGSGHHPQAAPG